MLFNSVQIQALCLNKSFSDSLKMVHDSVLLPDEALCTEVLLECVKGKGKEKTQCENVQT